MYAGPSVPRAEAGVAPSAHLGALVLGSRAPRRAAAWYRSALGLSGDGAVLTAGEAKIRFVSRADVAPAAVEAIRCIVNFHVDDVRAVEARLVDMEAVWVREVERTPWGMIGTVLDPDGNYVQIVEPDRGPLPWGAKGREKHS